MTRRTGILALLVGGALAGCGGASVAVPTSRTTPPPPSDTTDTTLPPASEPCDASLRPFAQQPEPGEMPDGILTEIVENGMLRVGVDQNTLGFGWRNRDGALEGFDIALAYEIGRALFGEDGHVDLVPVTSGERIGAVEDGDVDLVISVMSITCERRARVAFSAVYFLAHQRVLVPRESDIDSIEDLDGRTVCATSTSTSLDNLAVFAPEAVPYEVRARTDCLVALQRGLVDSISTDDTILLGFMAQDPKLELLEHEEVLSVERYGIAIDRDADHEDLVRFVNGVLEDVRESGQWNEFLESAEDQLSRRRSVEFPNDEPPEPHYVEDP
jgi:polar amino acid transport system substrate-binding protein